MTALTERTIRVGVLAISPTARAAWVEGELVKLSNLEWHLLLALASDPDRVFTKQELYGAVWGSQALAVSSRTLDSHASRLRLKLSRNGHSFVQNVWGVGYRLMAPLPLSSPGSTKRRSTLAEQYRSQYENELEAALALGRDLMRGEASAFKVGYDHLNATVACVELFELIASDQARLAVYLAGYAAGMGGHQEEWGAGFNAGWMEDPGRSLPA